MECKIRRLRPDPAGY